jgi:hypothetical protein
MRWVAIQKEWAAAGHAPENHEDPLDEPRGGECAVREEAMVADRETEPGCRGRRWLNEIVAGTITTVEQIAARDKCSTRQVNLTISLAFLAPKLVQAAVEGRLPRGIGVTRLRDAPAEWSRQYAMLGLST